MPSKKNGQNYYEKNFEKNFEKKPQQKWFLENLYVTYEKHYLI